jgi:aminoglycoside phosphotransferase (APT) family kinase protein
METPFDPTLHSKKPETPDSLIEDAIERAAGSAVVEKSEIAIGQINEVYSVKTEDGQEAIIRIFHGETSKFETDRWALEQCREAGVPVPEVRLVETRDHDGRPLHICVQSKIEGRGLNEIPDILAPEKNSELIDLLHQTGEVLTKIHSIPTQGFGRLDKNGKGKYGSIRELLIQEGEYSMQEALAAQNEIVFDTQVLTAGYEILKREAVNYPDISPRLIHNDFAPQHILINNNIISGIIDFDNANGGDPVYEFSRWRFAYDQQYPLKHIQEAYGNKEVFENDFNKKDAIWKIYRCLHSLRFNIKRERQDKVDKFMRGLAEGIEFFS